MLTDAQLIVLAHVIQDLDSEMDSVQIQSPLSSEIFNRFSGSLSSLMYNMIAMQILSEEQQNSLLAYLGFKPSQESWPLHHGIRSLSILAHIMLLSLKKEQEDIKLDLNSTTIQIWRGFINKLSQAALSFKGDYVSFNEECPDFHEDLNVEHAQLMLFLFHHLKLLQRKHVFSLVGTALNDISTKLNANRCSISAAQMLFIGRLLHLFEYMCKNLYDTPGYLFDQVNHNLLNLIRDNEAISFQKSFKTTMEEKASTIKDELRKSINSIRNTSFFVDEQLEINYLKHLTSSYKYLVDSNQSESEKSCFENDIVVSFFDSILHPRFYHLMDVNAPTVHKSNIIRNFKPKLDGKFIFNYVKLTRFISMFVLLLRNSM